MSILTRRHPDEEKKQLEDQVAELRRQIEQLRNELAHRQRTISDDERLRLIEEWRAELPALDERVDKSLEELRRIAGS